MRELKAAIDMGTNSARLLIGSMDAAEGIIQPVLLHRHITRLGGGFSRERGISPEAWKRSLEALSDFASLMQKEGVVKYRAVATSAVRDAVNGGEFVADVKEKTGIELETVDGRDEAFFTLKGVISGLDDREGNFLVFDIGGGSTEYTLAGAGDILFTRSLPLGVVRLTEGKKHREAMEDKITRELKKVYMHMEEAGMASLVESATLVGTAGTATTLAAIHLKMEDYDYRKVNNYVLTLEEIKEILNKLLPLTFEERLNVIGLEKGREDLIIAGILVTVKTMEMLGFKKMKISDYGLLEGLMLSV